MNTIERQSALDYIIIVSSTKIHGVTLTLQVNVCWSNQFDDVSFSRQMYSTGCTFVCVLFVELLVGGVLKIFSLI